MSKRSKRLALRVISGMNVRIEREFMRKRIDWNLYWSMSRMMNRATTRAGLDIPFSDLCRDTQALIEATP